MLCSPHSSRGSGSIPLPSLATYGDKSTQTFTNTAIDSGKESDKLGYTIDNKRIRNMKESFLENPFYPDLNDVMQTELVGAEKSIAKIMKFSQETGQVLDEEMTEIKEIIWRLTHKTRFVKLMTDSIHRLARLNSAGNKLFWIMAGSVSQESKDKDYCYLGLEHCQSMAKSAGLTLSKPTYYKGIDDLCENNIIAKSTRHSIYWLNISVLFNGNFTNLPKIKERDTIRRKLMAEGEVMTYQEQAKKRRLQKI